jgi:hypothetical protein
VLAWDEALYLRQIHEHDAAGDGQGDRADDGENVIQSWGQTVSWMASRQDSRPSSTTLSGRPSPA